MKKIFLALVAAIALVSCAELTPQPRRVEMRTTAGDIVLELSDLTPIHRDNFMQLVEERYFDSLLFHRVIENFMIQGGDPAPATSAAASSSPMARRRAIRATGRISPPRLTSPHSTISVALWPQPARVITLTPNAVHHVRSSISSGAAPLAMSSSTPSSSASRALRWVRSLCPTLSARCIKP